MSTTRLNLLSNMMVKHGFDAIAINPGPTLTYLTGLNFHLMERPTVLILSKSNTPVLILPELELLKVKESQIPIETIPFGDNPAAWHESFEKAAKIIGMGNLHIGVEPTRLRFLELSYLQSAFPSAIIADAENIFAGLRIQKDPVEIQWMKKAILIAQEALADTLPEIKIGKTEKEIASALVLNLFRRGSGTELPFMPIIASGPNSANPHAEPTERKIALGDLIVIDWGASYNGYNSDLTRTFAMGEVSPKLHEIYDIVKQANEAGRKAGKPKLPASVVDHAAREVISHAGYGSFFTHRTGHGLGMEAHEVPYMFGENTHPLTEGMVYTVEPGIYLPGLGGVRIEDNIVVTADGCETMSNFSRQYTDLSLS